MSRESIPKKIKEALLDEYDHRCAVCGADRPHIHHIDENPSHNELDNLLPLCPNCHLRDQHNPTRRIDIPKLRLFRIHKNPAILKPQFDPIYLRQLFLEKIEINEDRVNALEQQAKELTEFVASLEMGNFYGKQLKGLVGPINQIFLPGYTDSEYERKQNNANRNYRQKLVNNREAIQSLLVELLRYQSWANA